MPISRYSESTLAWVCSLMLSTVAIVKGIVYPLIRIVINYSPSYHSKLVRLDL